ncbi:hypothetical protein Ddc_16468 [Ditylenchus destructor]|nr:hypothetical protein Ddc_16468 [Ditylenchus destructor]
MLFGFISSLVLLCFITTIRGTSKETNDVSKSLSDLYKALHDSNTASELEQWYSVTFDDDLYDKFCEDFFPIGNNNKIAIGDLSKLTHFNNLSDSKDKSGFLRCIAQIMGPKVNAEGYLSELDVAKIAILLQLENWALDSKTTMKELMQLGEKAFSDILAPKKLFGKTVKTGSRFRLSKYLKACEEMLAHPEQAIPNRTNNVGLQLIGRQYNVDVPHIRLRSGGQNVVVFTSKARRDAYNNLKDYVSRFLTKSEVQKNESYKLPILLQNIDSYWEKIIVKSETNVQAIRNFLDSQDRQKKPGQLFNDLMVSIKGDGANQIRDYFHIELMRQQVSSFHSYYEIFTVVLYTYIRLFLFYSKIGIGAERSHEVKVAVIMDAVYDQILHPQNEGSNSDIKQLASTIVYLVENQTTISFGSAPSYTGKFEEMSLTRICAKLYYTSSIKLKEILQSSYSSVYKQSSFWTIFQQIFKINYDKNGGMTVSISIIPGNGSNKAITDHIKAHLSAFVKNGKISARDMDMMIKAMAGRALAGKVLFLKNEQSATQEDKKMIIDIAYILHRSFNKSQGAIPVTGVQPVQMPAYHNDMLSSSPELLPAINLNIRPRISKLFSTDKWDSTFIVRVVKDRFPLKNTAVSSTKMPYKKSNMDDIERDLAREFEKGKKRVTDHDGYSNVKVPYVEIAVAATTMLWEAYKMTVPSSMMAFRDYCLKTGECEAIVLERYMQGGSQSSNYASGYYSSYSNGYAAKEIANLYKRYVAAVSSTKGSSYYLYDNHVETYYGDSYSYNDPSSSSDSKPYYFGGTDSPSAAAALMSAAFR